MDKLLEQVLKYVPADIVPMILAIVVAFFGTYYFKGLRSYTDAMHDRAFLSLAIVVVGAFLLLQIQNSDKPEIQPNSHPLLLVPRFENDTGRELESLFVTQLRAEVERYGKDASIEQINGYLRDPETARLSAQDYKAVAVLVEPKIIREGVPKPVLCLRLFFLNSGRTATLAAIQTDGMSLGEISKALLAAAPQTAPMPGDPVIARLEALERRVAELSNAVLKATATNSSTVAERAKATKRAIVIGVDFTQDGKLPRLRFAASDARAMADSLKYYGFEVSMLLNEEATRPRIEQAIRDAIEKSNSKDELVLYYSGASARSSDAGTSPTASLLLPTYDFKWDDRSASLNLNAVVKQLGSASKLNRLIMLDGCHGTYGLEGLPADNDGSFQVMAASQDDQLAYEKPDVGGGVFTQALVRELQSSAKTSTSISTEELFSRVAAELARSKEFAQFPKFVSSSQKGIVFDVRQQKIP
ncbi:caspase family protein [Bradyrhizobium sp. BR13661]|jgi:hypothetical protein|uniref:caspase family protein n=1 Tax=Bradyrhizobium sp. BR13661 TaxID=2940622 RepID=UPI0024762223|nr:caspase family protein [Bradyrhizobium sp. BR13661]MDH6260750.1 hypothetical protein [Bradyrhizobium sp. BR13661]